MNNKWVINKIAALVVIIAVIVAFMRYYRFYDFGISANDRLIFWVPLAIIGVIGVVIYIWTFKAKKDAV
ncbi:MAG: hypothetical protein ABSA11_09770 [Candidatus Bathyarchaeia archaeon]|jgi:hypothetical protein